MNKAFLHSKGFTLIELVVIILLLTILSVTVLPRFQTTDAYEAYTYRSQLISALRLTQQRAMQQTNPNAVGAGQSFCHQIIIENKRYGIPNRLDCSVTSFPTGWEPDETGLIVDPSHDITISISGSANPSNVAFDSWGRPAATSDCAGGCLIDITSAVDAVQIAIEPEGYIHGL
ncbi:prepilin-type N-terminal cleavage/methylation domain-containing protein [Thalassotalea agarivorans]|uniref:MSHA pilin protein MshC n=1 Tax=Thalassotalea agarivorans TaxID=349064 RepID=A0A1I0FZX5_THASX|nr:prepilin-type N-terminal cleavage/methylation domain-containing protein [Thalassotalea agarivorans]SET63871.1 MSHA pilin protein MshC [Thalassotalea agarivorans]